MRKGCSNLQDWLDSLGQGMALETEVKLNTLANRVRKEVASMGGMLYYNWICAYALLNKSRNLFTDYLFSGRVNGYL